MDRRTSTIIALLVTLLLKCTEGQSEGNYSEVCYPPCGCFNDAPPFEDRPLPESPEDQEITWELYTRANRDDPVLIHWDEEIPEEYDPEKPTIFMVHGWWPRGPPPGVNATDSDDEFMEWDYLWFPEESDDGTVEPFLSNLRNAFLDKYDYNMIDVEWQTGAGYVFYPQSASNARVVGHCSGYLAEYITDLDLVHCIGHSLGGQVCGYMGSFTEGAMARLSGFDPAGPWFDKEDPAVRIDKTDAQYVENIYTNVNESLITLGLGKPVGHVDFYPNGGSRQPGCNDFYCDHQMATDYYRASIDSDCVFESYPCDSMLDATIGLCDSCPDGDCQSMGYYSIDYLPSNGTFYLTTLPDYPHCHF